MKRRTEDALTKARRIARERQRGLRASRQTIIELTGELGQARDREKDLEARLTELIKLGQDTETRRFIAKAESQKALIHELRYAIKAAVISMRDLATRSVKKVTPQHMAQLAAEAEKLVPYTDL